MPDLEEQPTQLPDIDTYLKLKNFLFVKSALIGSGNKATLVYRNDDEDTTIQIIRPADRETLLKDVISQYQDLRGATS